MLKRALPPERIASASSTCIEEKSRECHLVDFIGQDGCCHSFPLVQLVQCVLERNPAFQDQTGSVPDQLTIVFPTCDVVVLGWNLNALREALDLGKLVTVCARDGRYAGVEDKQPFVTGISVKAQP
jgi:hypothetical protein